MCVSIGERTILCYNQFPTHTVQCDMLRFVLPLLFLACAPTKETPTETPDCVEPFEVLHFETLQPSVVRLFFSLNKCDGQGIAGKTIENVELSEGEVAINAEQSYQKLIPAARAYDLRTVFLLDMSGSMMNSELLTEIQQAVWAIVNRLASQQKIAIFTFDGRQDIQPLVDFTQNPLVLFAGIESLSEYELQDNSTNLNGAAISGAQLLDAYATQTLPGLFQGSLIVFTDGTDQAGWSSNSETIEILSNTNNYIYTIGLGDKTDEQHLTSIGLSGYWPSPQITDLPDAFLAASNQISKWSESLYMLAYCSPKRNGNHTLKVQIDTLAKDFDFSATGFEGGCTDLDFFDELNVGELLPGDLVISEIMHTPSAVEDFRGEWFEIYNSTTQQINLKGLIVKSSNEQQFTVESDILIESGAFALFAARDNPNENGGMPNVALRYIVTDFSLEPNDTISLEQADGQIIDEIAYDATGEFPNVAGAALNLALLTAEDNDNPVNWCVATTPYGLGDFGTPGLINEECP